MTQPKKMQVIHLSLDETTTLIQDLRDMANHMVDTETVWEDLGNKTKDQYLFELADLIQSQIR